MQRRARRGWRGIRPICNPSFVIWPRSMAPSCVSNLPAASQDSSRGGSTHGKSWRSPSPQACNWSLALHRSTRRISGSKKADRARSDASDQSRMQTPGPTLPARPARWVADALEIFSNSNRSSPTSGANRKTLASPLSMTVWTPGIVSEVSAIFVATIIRRRGPTWMACDCSSILIEPYSGRTSMGSLSR